MIFAGMLSCVVGGFVFMAAPWVTWVGLVLFIGGLVVLGAADDYLPSEKKRSGNE